jgi:hypothetical protein
LCRISNGLRQWPYGMPVSRYNRAPTEIAEKTYRADHQGSGREVIFRSFRKRLQEERDSESYSQEDRELSKARSESQSCREACP